jgi:uncharacterized protein (DUF302 family)
MAVICVRRDHADDNVSFAAHRPDVAKGTAMSETEAGHSDGVLTKVSPRTVAETVTRFTGLAKAKGLRVFAVIDQAAEARQVGLQLRDTVLIIFGNPAAGTPVMTAAPLSALDLPLKFVVWDDEGQTKVSYVPPQTIAARYGLDPALAANLAAIGPLTDALVAS